MVGDPWREHAPGLRSLFKARRLDQVEDVARDGISALLDIPPDSFTVVWTMRHPNAPGRIVSTASRARAAAESAQRESSEATKAAVDALAGVGYTYRDIGTILGITHQRAQQIGSAPLRRTESTGAPRRTGRPTKSKEPDGFDRPLSERPSPTPPRPQTRRQEARRPLPRLVGRRGVVLRPVALREPVLGLGVAVERPRRRPPVAAPAPARGRAPLLAPTGSRPRSGRARRPAGRRSPAARCRSRSRRRRTPGVRRASSSAHAAPIEKPIAPIASPVRASSASSRSSASPASGPPMPTSSRFSTRCCASRSSSPPPPCRRGRARRRRSRYREPLGIARGRRRSAPPRVEDQHAGPAVAGAARHARRSTSEGIQ